MHTFVTQSAERFHYNSDYSGLIVIVAPDKEDKKIQRSVEIPMSSLIEFVGSYKLDKLKQEIEHINYKDFVEKDIRITRDGKN